MSARRERELDRRNCERSQSAGRLRSRTATRLSGDPNDLIRTMPAKGDRPADSCPGGETGALPPGAQSGESSCGCPRRRHRAYWRRSGAPPAGGAGNSPGPARSRPAPPSLACHRRWPPGSREGRCPARGRGLCRPVTEGAERPAAGGDRGGGELRRPQGRHGFPCQSRDSCSLPCFLSAGRRISRHDTSEPRRPAGKLAGPGASVAAPHPARSCTGFPSPAGLSVTAGPGRDDFAS